MMQSVTVGLSKSPKVSPFNPASLKKVADASLVESSSSQILEEVPEAHPMPPGMSITRNSEFKDNDEWFHGDSDILSNDDTDKLSSSTTTNISEGQSFPVGSHGTGSTPGSNNMNRPLLYSAIGSLENLNATSLGSLKKKLLATNGKSSLIPPPSIHSQPVNKPSEGSNDLHRQKAYPLPRDIQITVDESKGTEDHLDDSGEKQREKEITSKDGKPIEKGRRPSSLLNPARKREEGRDNNRKRVSYHKDSLTTAKPVEMFRPSCDAYTPRIEKKQIKYKAAEQRTPVQTMASPMGTLQRPNFRDALRRVAMIIHQHIVKIERRVERTGMDDNKQALFRTSMKDAFSEENFCTPTYKCTMVRIPMARPGMVFGLRKIKVKPEIPSEKEIYEFAHQLFQSVQLSSECSIVCLIYVERLMEVAKVPLLACTWRPIFMCGLLLASKVWQDLSSWNIEFASVYPQFSLDSINKLELNFLRNVKWDLYISSSLYAKYYFALRSIVEKHDFRRRYNRMVGMVDSVAQSEALKIQRRSEQVKEEALLQISRSM